MPTGPRWTGCSASGAAYWSSPVPESERDRTGGRAWDPADRDRDLGPGDGRAVRFRVPEEGYHVVAGPDPR